MSYILEALRKSEQQRQRGAAPGLLMPHATVEENSPPAFLMYGLIAAALIGAGVAIGWLRPWQHEPRLSATASAPAKMPESRPRPFLPGPLAVLPEITRKPAPERPMRKPWAAAKPAPVHLPPNAPAATRNRPPETTAPPAKEAAAPLRKAAAAPAPEQSIPPQDRSTAAPTEHKVIPMAELPLAIQREIPAMSIPVHTYSTTPQERIVGINDRLLQEGEYLAPGLKVEQIAPDGVVFSYKNYLFRRGFE